MAKRTGWVDHKKYISSVEWLLKKNEYYRIHVEQNWHIRCEFCHETDNLQVHHEDYDELGSEDLSPKASKDGRGVWQFRLLCKDCHYKNHKVPGFKEEMLKEVSRRVKILTEKKYGKK